MQSYVNIMSCHSVLDMEYRLNLDSLAAWRMTNGEDTVYCVLFTMVSSPAYLPFWGIFPE